jgi:hypothetical protein
VVVGWSNPAAEHGGEVVARRVVAGTDSSAEAMQREAANPVGQQPPAPSHERGDGCVVGGVRDSGERVEHGAGGGVGRGPQAGEQSEHDIGVQPDGEGVDAELQERRARHAVTVRSARFDDTGGEERFEPAWNQRREQLLELGEGGGCARFVDGLTPGLRGGK